jgi:hypothetical protein
MILNGNFSIKEFSAHTVQLINEQVDHRGQPHANLKTSIACNIGSRFDEFQELRLAVIEEVETLKRPPADDDETALNNVYNKMDALVTAVRNNCNSLDKVLAMDVAMVWVSWVSTLTKELKQISGLDRLAEVLFDKIMRLPLEYK